MYLKRIFAVALVLVMVFTVTACGKKTQETAKTAETEETDFSILYPLDEPPCYALEEGATPEQMRQTAVRALQDELSVPWFSKTPLNYNKSLNGKNTNFQTAINVQYNGLPYTDGSTSLFHWLRYYNYETGEISGITDTNINSYLGNSCASAVMWGWSAVTTTYKGQPCYSMNKANGALPLGDYKIPNGLGSYKEYTTQKICTDNGREVMYKAYAQLQPADGLVSYPHGGTGMHAMMAIAPSHVEYGTDGNIIENKSYAIVQDQRAGHNSTSTTYVVSDEEGNRSHYSGRLSAMISFNDLYENGYYVPVTLAEFIGQKPYETAKLAVKEKITDFNSLGKLTVNSNYKIVYLKLSALDPKTNEEVGASYRYSSGKEISSGVIYRSPTEVLIKDDALTGKLKKGTKYKFKLEAFVATGQLLTAAEAEIKY